MAFTFTHYSFRISTLKLKDAPTTTLITSKYAMTRQSDELRDKWRDNLREEIILMLVWLIPLRKNRLAFKVYPIRALWLMVAQNVISPTLNCNVADRVGLCIKMSFLHLFRFRFLDPFSFMLYLLFPGSAAIHCF